MALEVLAIFMSFLLSNYRVLGLLLALSHNTYIQSHFHMNIFMPFVAFLTFTEV